MINVILLEPMIAGNVGAVARAMKNFGFKNLVLINPHCSHLGADARNRAKHSQDVLESAEVTDFFVVDDYDYLIATTARVGTDYNIPRSPLSPAELAAKLKNISPKKRIGLVIGREGTGLFNEEIEKCDFVVTIPSSTEYPTLNISHAVAVILYELHKTLSKRTSTSHITPIGKQEKDQILKMFEQVFSHMRWETKEKRETQQKLWKKIIGKALLTKREAYGIMGFLRKVIRELGKEKATKMKPVSGTARKNKSLLKPAGKRDSLSKTLKRETTSKRNNKSEGKSPAPKRTKQRRTAGKHKAKICTTRKMTRTSE